MSISQGPWVPRDNGTGSTGGGGDDMDEIKRRLEKVEGDIGTLRVDVATIAATIPQLATKSDLDALRVEVATLATNSAHLATKADVADLQTRMIQWIVATMLTVGGILVGVILKVVH